MATLTISITSTPVTGSKAYTISNADTQAVLDWAKVNFNSYIQVTFNPGADPAFVPTNQQILLAWVQNWVDETKEGVLGFKQRSAVTTTAPIVIT